MLAAAGAEPRVCTLPAVTCERSAAATRRAAHVPRRQRGSVYTVGGDSFAQRSLARAAGAPTAASPHRRLRGGASLGAIRAPGPLALVFWAPDALRSRFNARQPSPFSHTSGMKNRFLNLIANLQEQGDEARACDSAARGHLPKC